MDLEHCHSSDPQLVKQEIWTAMLTSLIARAMETTLKGDSPSQGAQEGKRRENHACAISLVSDMIATMTKARKRYNEKKAHGKIKGRVSREKRFRTMNRISGWYEHSESRFFPRIVKHPVSCFARNAKRENEIKKFYQLGGIYDQPWK